MVLQSRLQGFSLPRNISVVHYVSFTSSEKFRAAAIASQVLACASLKCRRENEPINEEPLRLKAPYTPLRKVIPLEY